MGIHNLNTLLRKKCPEIFKEVHLSNLAYSKVAIDISLFMFKYKTINGDNWLSGFLSLFECLRKNHIHPIFVYDSEAPPEKKEEQLRRRETRDIIRQKNEQIKKDFEEYKKNGSHSELLNEIVSKKTDGKLLETSKSEYYKIVEAEIRKLEIQTISITKEDFDLTKQLFDVLGVSYISAPIGGEAEKTCSELCINGVVDAVMSEDTDVMAYGTPLFLTKLNTFNSTCVAIEIKSIYRSLEIDYNQFRDICIMCGNDYNTNIPKVGPITSLNYIQECGSIENIETFKKIDISILKHIRSRELFSIENTSDEVKKEINFVRKNVNHDEISEFLKKNNCGKFCNRIFELYQSNITFL
jgi:5'-3' exonuclease